jgi:tRNA uridine 5-carboxymethylaminomethyl modification enzyme
MSPYGRRYNLYSKEELAVIDLQESDLRQMIALLKSTRFKSQMLSERYGLTTKHGSLSMADLICRPDFETEQLIELSGNGLGDNRDIFDKAAILIKYDGYLEKQDREIERFQKNEAVQIPESFDYRSLTVLKTEAVEKLERFRPRTLGQASRIEGVTPSDLAALTIHLKKR